MSRLLGLELLRGVAATLVLLEHVPRVVESTIGEGRVVPDALASFHGYWGVDLFFVLSGYLIGLTLDKPGTTARSFLLARLARVLPLYAIASLACLAVPRFRTAEVSGSMLVTTFTLLPVSGDALEPLTAHPCGWTLCYEFLFYLAAATLTAALGVRRAVPTLLALFALAPLAFAAAGPVAGWAYPSFALSPLTTEFALGLLAYRLTGVVPKWAGWALLGLGVAGCVYGVVFGGDGANPFDALADPRLALARVATWGLPAFACVLGTARLDRAGTFKPVARLATAAGAVSYSLYLVQPCSLAVAATLCVVAGVAQPWPVAAVTVGVSFAIAAAVARSVDRPLHALAKGWAKRLSAPRQASSARSFWTFASIRSRTLR